MKIKKKIDLKTRLSFGMNKVILLLRKGTYSYEFMDDWKTFNKTSLPEKKKKKKFILT